MVVLIGVAWYILIIIQYFLGYGTAYRLTKAGGDNGASLFGWQILMGLASIIPGLGIILWVSFREVDESQENDYRPSEAYGGRTALSANTQDYVTSQATGSDAAEAPGSPAANAQGNAPLGQKTNTAPNIAECPNCKRTRGRFLEKGNAYGL